MLFAHWSLPPEAVRHLVPDPLDIDELDGSTWIGVVPLRMEGVARRPLPDLPWISAFPELNVRLYVRYRGRPGVWFLSLDAGNRLAVWAARRFFHLPYHHAEIRVEEAAEGRVLDYRSRRKRDGTAFRATYRPAGDPYEAEGGSLERFLTERYCLFTQARAGDILTVEIHHAPWPLQAAEAEIETNGVLDIFGLPVGAAPDWLHYARELDVVHWPLEPAAPLAG